MHQVAAVEFCRDVDGQRLAAPRPLHRLTLGYRADEISAQTDEALHRAVQNAFAGIYRGPAPYRRGGSKSNIFASLSSGTNSGFSEMPTVRWPCTLE